ncbi:MAG TPA: hypothetical protein PKA64_20865 [Myxococcota bacterium]|nr:hypothetical protein [Myxococcota bacterium]
MPHDLPPHDVEISTFDHAWDVAAKPVRCLVGGLVRALTTFPVLRVADKRALPAWSPAMFAPGATRRADAVRAVSCLVLDVDDGDPEVAFAPWPGLLTVMHTTWSHRPEAPPFRVVLPLARPVPADRWGEAWAWAAVRTAIADPACKDPSRLYFRPAVPDAEAPRIASVQAGALLDLVAMLPDDPPPRHPAAARPVVRVPARLCVHPVSMRLAHDPTTRERVAAELGAHLVGVGADRRATHATCPACARPSVWFYLEPRRLRRALCNHRATCGWEGSLDALLERRAA